MTHKTLLPLLCLTTIGPLAPLAEAIDRWPGAACQSLDNSNDITLNTAGTIRNNSATVTRGVICPVRMPTSFLAGAQVMVQVNFDTSAEVYCVLRVTNVSGSTQQWVDGKSSPQGVLTLSLTNNSGGSISCSANLRCSLPKTSAAGAQGIVWYDVTSP